MSADGLTGGEWRPVGGVMRWFPTLSLVPVARRHRSLTDLIACPTCHAKLTEQCKTATGNTTIHKDRILKRRCPCGVPVRPRHRYCDRCQTKARTLTYRTREIHTPTARRRRAA